MSRSFTGAPNISGVDLFITHLDTNPFSASEISTLRSFLTGGGSVMLMADSGLSQATRVNSALSGLGSVMRVANIGTSYDSGNQSTTGTDIAVDPFTAGVTSLRWGSTHEITGGTPLLYTNSQPRAWMAYEIIPEAAVSEPGMLALLSIGTLTLDFGFRRRRH